MAFKSLSKSNIITKTVGFTTPAISVSGPWVRNPTWLTMPSVTSSDEKFVGLHAVYPSGSIVAFVASGAFTVNWGDGSGAVNYAANTTASYEYNYNSASLVGSEGVVTFQTATNTVTRNSHGYTNGMNISFASGSGSVTSSIVYYVTSSAANTFKLLDAAGSLLSISQDGTGSILEYRQAFITITPTGLDKLNYLNLNTRHPTLSPTVSYGSNLLDCIVSGPNLNILNVGASDFNGNRNINMTNTERFNVVNHSIVSASFMFLNATGLRSVSFSGNNTVTNMSSMFNGCSSLNTVSLSNTSAVTNMFAMFANCSALTTVPWFDTAAATTTNSMFSACYSLKTVLISNTGAVTDMGNMFSNCSSLTSVPLFNTAAVTTMSGMFSLCFSLTSVPLFNTAAVTIMSTMFSNCFSLPSVPLFNTTAVITMASMFNACYSLTSVPLFNTSAVLVMSSMFVNCYSLRTVPLFNTAAVTTMASMFSGCRALTSVPLFNTAAVTTMTLMFSACYSLITVPLFNTVGVTNMSNMFSNCFSLITVPPFNTVAVTNMISMFPNCYSLTSVPLFNTAAITNMSSMFDGCRTLNTISNIDFNRSGITSSGGYSNMFNSCANLSRIATTSGPKFTFSVSGCKLSANALNELFTSLPTVTSQTITISSNYGAATCNRTIATNKGWTVTG